MGTTTSNTNLDGDDLDAIIQDMVLDDANSSTTMSANNSVNNDNDENYVEEETDQNGSILYNNVDKDNLLTGVLTPPRHSPIQISNYNNNNSNDSSSNNITHEKESFQTPPRSTSPIPVLLKVTSKATLSNLKNFKTPSPTKDHNIHRFSAATTSKKHIGQQQHQAFLHNIRSNSSPSSTRNNSDNSTDKIVRRATTQPDITTTPTKNIIKNTIEDSRVLRRQTQSAPNRRRKESSRGRNSNSPRSRKEKKVATYRKSMLSQTLSVQQRYRKKLEREAREKISRTRTQEKRDKRYHFALNAWQQIDRKEWENKPKPYFKRKQSTIKNLVKRYGIPSPYRYHVWKLLIGNDAHITKELFNVFAQRAMEVYEAEEEREKFANNLHIAANNPNVNTSSSTGGSSDNSVVVANAKDEKSMYGKETSVLSIGVDLNRTFPKLAFFRHDGSHHKPLKQVLAAYCFYRPDCGYVQGMSFLAAMLLLQMGIEDPYETFVVLVNIMGRDDGKLLKFYKLNVQENKEVFKTFNDVLNLKLPAVYTHLKKVGVTPEMFLLPWWMTIFSKYLGLDLAVRVWDGYMVFGTPYLTQVALGILNVCQNEILNGDFGTCLKICLRNLPSSITEDMLFDSIEAMG